MLATLLQAGLLSFPFEDFLLAPMALDQIARIVEGPAVVGALTVEAGLAQRIADDIKSTDALPLLAFALRDLFERLGDERRLSIAGYERMGDAANGLTPMANAVRRKADDVLASLKASDAELKELKQAFIPGLVQLQDDRFVRQPANLALLPVGSRKLIDAFTEARLLTRRGSPSGDETVVEVSHEALFSAWPLLVGWLNGEREFLAGKAQLAHAFAEWRAASPRDKPNALLKDWPYAHAPVVGEPRIRLLAGGARLCRGEPATGEPDGGSPSSVSPPRLWRSSR